MAGNETQRVNDIEGKQLTYIDPNSANDHNFALHLVGSSVSDLYKVLNENFIRLTQNFYSETQPINPVIGQNWFNKSDNMTYKWMGHNWVQTEKDMTYDSFLYIKYNIAGTREFVFDESVFNFTIENIKLYDQDFKDAKFVIDTYDARKIILKESNITTLYLLIFHPKDRISNPFRNRRLDFITTSGQTQFDLGAFLNDESVNTLSVSLNDVMMKSNEFFVVNNILNISGKVYRVRPNNKLTVWLHGGSMSGYYTDLKIIPNRKEMIIKIPKFFRKIEYLEIVDVDKQVCVNPMVVTEHNEYFYFEFLDKKNVVINMRVRII